MIKNSLLGFEIAGLKIILTQEKYILATVVQFNYGPKRQIPLAPVIANLTQTVLVQFLLKLSHVLERHVSNVRSNILFDPRIM